MSSGNDGEKLLIEKIKEGEEYAFEIAFLKYFTPLSRYICKFVRSEQQAREIVQEVFADIWENRGNLNASGHLRGLLYEVGRNKAIDRIKHQKVVDDYISTKKREKKDTAHQKPQSDERYRGLQEAADEAVKELPPRARQIYELNRYDGLTYKEISEYLDISVKTVETHMRRGLKKLRERLSHFVPVFMMVCNSLYLLF